MSAKVSWLLTAAGKWHAWFDGSRSTVCGRINAEHVRQTPAVQIDTNPPADGLLCRGCARRTGKAAETAAHPDLVVAAWMGHIRRHLTRLHVRVAETTVAELATLLAEIGAPESAEAREVFDQVQSLLLKPTYTRKKNYVGHVQKFVTIPHLKEALAKLPPRTGALAQIASVLRTWKAITRRDPTLDNFRSDRVVETMLQLPSPEPYIRHLQERGLPHLAAMFHPNTLERAKKDASLRGLFAGSNDYWKATTTQLNIVTD